MFIKSILIYNKLSKSFTVSAVVYRWKDGKLVAHKLIRKMPIGPITTTTKKPNKSTIITTTATYQSTVITSLKTISTKPVQIKNSSTSITKDLISYLKKNSSYPKTIKDNVNKFMNSQTGNSKSSINGEYSLANKLEIDKFEESLTKSNEKYDIKRMLLNFFQQLQNSSKFKDKTKQVINITTLKPKNPTMPSRLNFVKLVPDYKHKNAISLKSRIKDKYLVKTIGGIFAAFIIIAIILAVIVVKLVQIYNFP